MKTKDVILAKLEKAITDPEVCFLRTCRPHRYMHVMLCTAFVGASWNCNIKNVKLDKNFIIYSTVDIDLFLEQHQDSKLSVYAYHIYVHPVQLHILEIQEIIRSIIDKGCPKWSDSAIVQLEEHKEHHSKDIYYILYFINAPKAQTAEQFAQDYEEYKRNAKLAEEWYSNHE
jgi:hypothetical protein